MNIAVVNLGLKSIRCILLSEEGEKLGAAAKPVHTDLKASFVEQDANEWLSSCEDVIAGAMQDAGVDKSAIHGMTFTASASCLVPANKKGEPTHPVIMVSDSRAAGEARELNRQPGFKKIIEKTGLEATPDLMIPKMLWLKKNKPEVYESTDWFFSPADFLAFHFTGEASIDVNNALKYHAYEEGNKRYYYDEALLASLGLDVSKLPEIKFPGTVLGTIKPDVAEQYHLSPDTKVVMSTYDALCALVGSGVSVEGTAAVVSGTVTSVRTLADDSITVSTKGILQSEWIEKNAELMIVGGSNNLGGGLIEWHKQAFYYDLEGDPYERMDREAETIPRGSEGLLFLPYLLGERAPVWDSQARGIMFGLDRRHTRPHFTRAVYESVAFSTKHILEYIMSNGLKIDEIRFSGGLARSPVVSKILSDVLQIKVKRPAEFETTSLGAHIISLYALGRFKSINEGCKHIVTTADEYEPDPSAAELYRNIFEMYKKLYSQTREMQDDRSKLMQRFEDILDAGITSRENL